MQNKNHWYRNFRFKLFVVLCAIALLTSAVFVNQPVLAREASGKADSQAAQSEDDTFSVVSWGSGRLDLFAVKSDGTISIRSDDACCGWYPWASLGKPAGSFFSKVEAVSMQFNRLDVFGVSIPDNTIWHIAYNGSSWGSWENIGGGGPQFYNSIQAVSWGPGRIDLFTNTNYSYQGTGTFQHKWWTSGAGWGPSQTGWESLDTSTTKFTVSVVSWGVNRLDIIRANSSDYTTGHKYWDGTGWKPTIWPGLPTWQNLNGLSETFPNVVSWGLNRLDTFVRGSDRGIWINSSSDGLNWNGWNSLGVGASGSPGFWTAPTAVAWGPNRLDVFDYEGDATYHKAWTGTSWWPSVTGWENLGNSPTPIVNSPEAVAWGPSRLDIFGRANSWGHIWHKWSNGGGWGPSQSTWEDLGAP